MRLCVAVPSFVPSPWDGHLAAVKLSQQPMKSNDKEVVFHSLGFDEYVIIAVELSSSNWQEQTRRL